MHFFVSADMNACTCDCAETYASHRFDFGFLRALSNSVCLNLATRPLQQTKQKQLM